MLCAHLEALKHLGAALDPPYAAFSDGQKRLADKQIIGPTRHDVGVPYRTIRSAGG